MFNVKASHQPQPAVKGAKNKPDRRERMTRHVSGRLETRVCTPALSFLAGLPMAVHVVDRLTLGGALCMEV